MSGVASIARVALITGAAGGLGQALVHQLRRAGWRVVAGVHRQNPFAEAENLWPLALDVTDRAAVTAAVARVTERWQRMDLLVNNAGITADRLAWQMSGAEWDRVLDVNLKGAFICSQAVLGSMLGQREGSIVNLASFSARVGPVGQANYAASKAGLIGLTQSLAREVGPHNVRVNAVLPGVLRTPMTAELTDERLAELTAANALGRLNSPVEVARFVTLLAAMENVSGQVFQLDSRVARWT